MIFFFYYCKYFNYLLFRTAIEVLHAVRQSRTSSQILFAVCLSKKQALTGGKSLAREDKCSKKIGAKSTVSILVYFYILCNNKNYKKASEGLSDIEAMKHADSVANEYLNKTLEDNEL